MKNLIAILILLCTGNLLSAQQKPNVILIMADDLGYGDLGCYGAGQIQTPNLDAMAAKGIKFTNYYSGSTICAPSRAALMTGKHTGHTFIRGNFQTDKNENPALPSENVTIAESMKRAGYRTALIGKWGLGGIGNGPDKQGFDYSYGYLDQVEAHNYYPPHLIENDKKVLLEKNANGKQGDYSHNLFVNKTVDYIDSSENQPFFLYLPYTIPHGKHVIPDDAPYSSKGWPQSMKNYAAMITLLDRDIGRILNMLKEKGIQENTLVIFTSDNGANPGFAKFFKSNGSFRGAKRDFYEGGIRVPLVACWPGKIKPGRVSSHISAAWDLFPTICEVAAVTHSQNLDGISFLPELLGQKQITHDYLYWEEYPYNYDWKKPDNKIARNYLDRRAVRMGKWKAVQNNMYQDKAAGIELYDLEKDLAEEKNLANNHPDIIKKIRTIMDTASTPDAPYFPYEKSE